MMVRNNDEVELRRIYLLPLTKWTGAWRAPRRSEFSAVGDNSRGHGRRHGTSSVATTDDDSDSVIRLN